MANTRELRRRIKSVKNTAQITKAMEMVSATKMRRAQNQALSGRPYSTTLQESLAKLSGKVNPEKNRLLQTNSSSKTGLILFSTDKSLCGALNTNVFRKVLEFIKEKKAVQFYTVGTKGRNMIVRTGNTLMADFENSDKVDFRRAKQLSKLVIEGFLSGDLGEVYLAYPDFISTIRQEPKVVKLLPIDKSIVGQNIVVTGEKITTETTTRDTRGTLDTSEFLIEPNPDELLDFVLTHEIETQIYQALLETKASEHSARMMAMQNATNNAKDLVDDLNLTYNQTRQDAITRELLEITTAAAALE